MTYFRTALGNRIIRALFSFLYIVFVIAPFTMALLIGRFSSDGNLLSRPGDALILIVFPMLALQPVLAARLRVLDRSFGLDIIYIIHKTMGMTAGAALVCAFVFQIVSQGFLLSWLGIVTAILLSILVLSALLYHELGLTYEKWRRIHNVLALVVLTAVFLQTLAVVPQIGKWLVQSILVLYFITGITAYTYHRIIGPTGRRKRLYRVERIERETHNVWTLMLKPPKDAELFDYLPGQFQFLTFDGGKGEEHPFTISSSPTQSTYHTASIKESGDFTRRIGEVREGDFIAVQAPFGRFSYVLHPEEKDIVFIAGGIGITPFISMLRHMRDNRADKNLLLLYANNTEEDIAFRRELEELSAGNAPRLRVVHVLAKPGENWNGERGRIDWQMIEKQVTGEFRGKVFYVCGPPLMMNALITAIIEHGVPSQQVRSERFAL